MASTISRRAWRDPGGGERGIDSRARIARSSVASLAALAACLALPAAAQAGTYEVVACDAAPGAANAAWSAHDDPGTLAATSCPTGSDERRGLTVRNLLDEGTVGRGEGASMTFQVPAGTTLERIGYDWDGRQADTDWTVGLVGESRADLIAGCPARPGADGRCRLGTKGAPDPRAHDLDGRREVSLVATCAARGGCSTKPLGSQTDRTRARLAAHSATVEIADSSRPDLSTTGGELLADRWLRGTVEASLSAQDNVGLRATTFDVDGERRRTDARECDYTRAIPCPRAVAPAYALDTTDLADGSHQVAFAAIDTAANRSSLSRTIRVDNHAPGPVDDLHVVGGEETRAENSFDVRWTVPGGQAAPVARAHYRLCPADSSSGCGSGVRDGSIDSITGLSVPQRGDWRLDVWLGDAAGNSDPSSAPEPVTLSFDDRTPTTLSAGIAGGTGASADQAIVDYGEETTITGALVDAGGDRLEGAPIAVLARRSGDVGFQRLATVETNDQGAFLYRPPAGPSRRLRFEYGGSDRHRRAAAEVTLWVRAGSSISVSDRRVRNGDRVRFRGTLRGEPYPSGGKLVELQAFYRDRWRTFAVTRTDRDGDWAYRYRFGGTRGRLTYPFRARIPRERDYPYVLGHSRVVRVTVNGG